jgi:hypothetical protein
MDPRVRVIVFVNPKAKRLLQTRADIHNPYSYAGSAVRSPIGTASATAL